MAHLCWLQPLLGVRLALECFLERFLECFWECFLDCVLEHVESVEVGSMEELEHLEGSKSMSWSESVELKNIGVESN